MSQVILFDLDGTLTESGEGITKSVQYALEKMGIVETDLEKLRCFVGPPLKEQFMAYAGFDEEQAEQAVEFYRERYTTTGIFENHLYPQIPQLLEVLKINDKIMGVASSKPEIYVRQILEHFQITEYFQVIVGSELDGTRTDKAQVIDEALHRLHMEKERDKVLMVGDKEYDVIGAKSCGIQCVGVTYGYGSREELEKAGAVYFAETVDDLGILASPNDEETTEYVESVRKPYRKKLKKKREHSYEECEKKKQQTTELSGAMAYTPTRQAWRIVYPVLMHFAITFLVASAFSAYYVWKVMSGHTSEAVVLGQAVLTSNLKQIIVTSVISAAITFFIYRRDQQKRKAGHKGLCLDCVWSPMIVWCSVFIFAIAGSQLLNDLIWLLKLNTLFPAYEQIMGMTLEGQNMFLQILGVGICAPVAEELIFRGLVFRRMKDCIKPVWAIVISSLLFGIFHGNMIQFIYATLFGVILAVIYNKTGTLWTAILAHAAANLWSLLGAEWWNVTIRQSIAGIIGTIIFEIICCVVAGYWFFAYKTKEK